MNDETIKIQVRDTIDRNTPDYMSCIAMLEQAEHTADRIRTTVKPSLFTERYFTSAEVMRYLHISRRALQNYRDNGEIPYTAIGGILLYPETKLNEILEKNYRKMLEQPREMGEMTLKDFVPMSLRCQMRSNRKSGKCKEKQNIAGERFANHYPRRCKI